MRHAGAAPDHGAHPRQQLAHLERLQDVVVGAAVDAAYLLAPAAAGGEHQHRDHHAAGAPALEQRQPVDARQPQIEDDRVVLLGGGEKVGALAVGGDVDHIPALSAAGGEPAGQQRLILDDQDSHSTAVRRH